MRALPGRGLCHTGALRRYCTGRGAGFHPVGPIGGIGGIAHR
jgi:hypothetical protein